MQAFTGFYLATNFMFTPTSGSSVGAGRQEGVTILFFPGRYKRPVPKTAELVLVWLKLNKLLGKAKLASKLPGAVRPAPAS